MLFAAGCDEQFHTIWHGETLSSGAMVKITSLNLVWGTDYDDRDVHKDSFAIEYVTADPGADTVRREAEASQVFRTRAAGIGAMGISLGHACSISDT